MQTPEQIRRADSKLIGFASHHPIVLAVNRLKDGGIIIYQLVVSNLNNCLFDNKFQTALARQDRNIAKTTGLDYELLTATHEQARPDGEIIYNSIHQGSL